MSIIRGTKSSYQGSYSTDNSFTVASMYEETKGTFDKTKFQLNHKIKEENIIIKASLLLKENRVGFNFILKEHRKGVIYMGSQIDNCLHIVFPDGKENYSFKTKSLIF